MTLEKEFHKLLEAVGTNVGTTVGKMFPQSFQVTWKTSRVVLFIDIFIVMNNNYILLFIPLPKVTLENKHTVYLCCDDI